MGNFISAEDQARLTLQCVERKDPEEIINRLLRIHDYMLYWCSKTRTFDEIEHQTECQRYLMITTLIRIDYERGSEHLRSYFGRIPSKDQVQQQTFVNAIGMNGYQSSMRNIKGVTIYCLHRVIKSFSRNSNNNNEFTLRFILANFEFTPMSKILSIIVLAEMGIHNEALTIYNTMNTTRQKFMIYADLLSGIEKNKKDTILNAFFKAVGIE
jgi:hypothetical protein